MKQQLARSLLSRQEEQKVALVFHAIANFAMNISTPSLIPENQELFLNLSKCCVEAYQKHKSRVNSNLGVKFWLLPSQPLLQQASAKCGSAVSDGVSEHNRADALSPRLTQ